MSSKNTLSSGPSVGEKGQETVEIKRSNAERYRWRCPHGHLDWAPTNSHLWCRTCLRMNEAGNDVDPEHYHIVDAKQDKMIPWDQVTLLE